MTELEDESEWSDTEVTGDLTGAIATLLDVERCVLRDLRLTGARVEKLRVADTEVVDSDLSGAVLAGASWTHVVLRHCRLSGVDLSTGRFDDVRFEGCKLDGANLRRITALRLHVDDCVLRDADLGGARLEESRFYDCDLTAVELSKASLAGTRLHGSTFDGIRGAEQLRGVVVQEAQVLPLGRAVLGSLGVTVDEER